MVLPITLLLVPFLLGSCRYDRLGTSNKNVLVRTTTYAIGVQSDGDYVIHAMSLDIAKQAAEKELDCKKRCIYIPDGVIVVVKRGDAPATTGKKTPKR